MIKIEIKNRFTGKIIFEYSKENNTVLETVLEAIKGNKSLDGANLDGANLDGANLYGANLDGANLYGANLDGANLTRANLDGANLTRANLDGANLYGANLTRANLDGANLYGANLTRASLDGANLDGANLYGANLYGANLDISTLPNLHLYQTIPQGELIGWKKVHGVIVKLKIPYEAKRVHGIGSRKCRAEFAEVLDVENEQKEVLNKAYAHHVLYKVGEIVKPDSFLDCIKTECGNGINFFISREEAVNY